MDEKRVRELLAAHTDALVGRAEAMRQLNVTDEEREDVADLFALSERLHARLKPVHPPQEFVESLKQELMEEAPRAFAKARKKRRRVIIWTAVGGSIASVVGAVVFFLVRRHSRAHATT